MVQCYSGMVLSNDGQWQSVLWGVKGDMLSTFSASTWGLILPKAVRSASSWGFVVGLKHGTGCE